MSKQLGISATVAVLSMAVVALATSLGGISESQPAHVAGKAPLFEGVVGR